MLTRCNEKTFGEKIKIPDVVEYAVNLLKESDINKIQKQSFTLKDLIAIEHQNYNLKSKKTYSLDEFIAHKLKIQ